MLNKVGCLLLCWLTWSVQAGEVVIYYWKDAKGQDQYSDTKPKGVDYKTMRLGLYEGYRSTHKKSTSGSNSGSAKSNARVRIPPSTIPAHKMSDGNKRDTKAIWREKRPKLCDFYQKQSAELEAQTGGNLSAEQQAKLQSRLKFARGQARAYCR